MVMVSLSVLLGVFSAAAGTWMATAEGNTAELGAAALVLPNAPAGAGSGSGTDLAGGQVQTTDPGQPAAPTTSAPTPTTSSAAPTPTETSAAPQPSTSEAPPPTTKPAARVAPSVAAQVVTLVNDERAKAGCSPLAEESHVTKAAQDFSDKMSAEDFFSHTSPDGTTFDQRIKQAGYSKPGAENIARGQTSAAQVMDSWMNSEGHRANILNCSLKKIGVGVTTDGWYWVQDFGY
ncbi:MULTISPECIES: CAP domain-containing protein [unclassified Amycolatopsis]|uniref:CAP domain-containing protein n=1 Tax=unclassified Amycolatopsis TaxID=2618356 RepID=UPI002874B5DF|nr:MULTISPECIES: CAP domain-containing protein [unclassified Amycolatopsis]MDS0134091.1 CAP domain-containing protein [Amycolatopsis sp. 505]MDS0144967.1 CAP domain-containing protein [Amycolatopsis sp. CM201R]